MPNTCSICRRKDVADIDRDILAGVPFNALHEKYGASVGALHRHSVHLKQELNIKPALQIGDMETAVSRVRELEARADKLYKDSVKSGDRLNSLRALKEMREVVELCAKLTGELNQQQTVVHQHLHVTPEWAALRSVMLQALQPYPEARAALVAALEGSRALEGPAPIGEAPEVNDAGE